MNVKGTEKEQEHNHAHAFGGAIFLVVLIGLLALSFIWQNSSDNSQTISEPLASGAIAVLPADPDAPLAQPRSAGQFLEGDSLNGFEPETVGYVNNDFRISFVYLRTFELRNTVDEESGLRVALADTQGEEPFILLSARDRDPSQAIEQLIEQDAPLEEDIVRSQTEAGDDMVRYSVQDGEVSRYVATVVTDEFYYNFSYDGSADADGESMIEVYDAIVDTLVIQ